MGLLRDAENKQVVARGEGNGGEMRELGERDSEVHISSYKINESQEWNVQCWENIK